VLFGVVAFGGEVFECVVYYLVELVCFFGCEVWVVVVDGGELLLFVVWFGGFVVVLGGEVVV